MLQNQRNMPWCDISLFNWVIIILYLCNTGLSIFIRLHFETQHNAMVVSVAAAVLVAILYALHGNIDHIFNFVD